MATALKHQESEQLSIEIPDGARKLRVQYVPREYVHPDPAQPRVEADAELRASIAATGILQPITVRPHPTLSGAWMIVDGERRWRASEGVQDEIPVIPRRDQEDEYDRLRTQLVANTGKPLTPVEEARSFARMLEMRRCSIEQLAKDLGRPRSTVSERLALLELGPWVKPIADGVVPVSYAVRALLPLRNAPDSVHAAAVEAVLPQMERVTEYAQFLRLVREAYKPAAYPLVASKASWEPQPIFNTKKHDAECGCGAPAYAFGYNAEETRRACLNPDWWKPLDKKGRAAKEKAEKAKQNAPVEETVPVHVALPAGAEIVRAPSAWQDPDGIVVLTSIHGDWRAPGGYGDDRAYDPADVVIEEAQLVGVRTFSGVAVGTRDLAAVEAARDRWAARWVARLEELRGQFRSAVATSEMRIAGQGIAGLLLFLLQRTDDAGLFHKVASDLGIALPPDDDVEPQEDYGDFAAYFRQLPPRDLELLGRALAWASDPRNELPSRAVLREERDALDAIGERRSPWAIGDEQEESASEDDEIEAGYEVADGADDLWDDEDEDSGDAWDAEDDEA